nr:MAG TPA: hypothetical protein [Caudoviricetes sp.]
MRNAKFFHKPCCYHGYIAMVVIFICTSMT